MFVAPMDANGVKLISRASYEMVAGATGSPYDYPLSSRFDENDAILVMDNVLIPWENVLIYRDFDRCRRWTMEGGFARMYPLQACVRLAVKLDFITALLKKSLECTGTLEFRGVQADLGEVVAWRNTFWALSDSMCSEATGLIYRIMPHCKPIAYWHQWPTRRSKTLSNATLPVA